MRVRSVWGWLAAVWTLAGYCGQCAALTDRATPQVTTPRIMQWLILLGDTDGALISKNADGALPATVEFRTLGDIDVTADCLSNSQRIPKANDNWFFCSAEKTTHAGPVRLAYALDAAGNCCAASAVLSPCFKKFHLVSDAIGHMTLCMMTSHNETVLALDRQITPLSMSSFTTYAKEGFYTAPLIYRIVSAFIVQDRAYVLKDGQRVQNTATVPTIALEKAFVTGFPNTKDTSATASANSPNSGTRELFINIFNNSSKLNAGNSTEASNGYAVIDGVIHGLYAAAQVIRHESVVSNGTGVDQPVNNVSIH